MNPTMATRGAGTRSAESDQSKSGKGVVAASKIAAWMATHVRNTTLAKRTVPGREAVQPTTGRLERASPGTVKGRLSAARTNGKATNERRREKVHPKPV